MISILYVDDEPGLLELCRIFLEQSGDFRVDTADSAEEALARIAKTPYDAVVSDYQMPGINGISLLKSIRGQFRDLPFILFTGRGREEVVIDAVNNGADFYLQKGGDPKAQFVELMHKVRQAVDKKQAERDLFESEKRLTDIINFLPDATFAIDREGRVIAWNRAIEDLTGIPSVDMIGKGDHEYAIPFYSRRRPLLIDLIFEPDEQIQKQYSGIRREKDILIAESDLPRPRGKQLTIMGKASPLYDRQGNPAGAIESIRDITARKQAEDELRAAYEEIRITDEELRRQYDIISRNEQALKDSEEKYRTLVENNQDIIYIYRNDRILVINRRGPEVLGYTEDELRNMSIWDLLHPDDRQRVFDRGKARMQGADIPPRYTARIMTKSGRAIPMDLIAVLVTYRGERAIMGIARDVTEREELIGSMARKTSVLTIINRIVQIAGRTRDMSELMDTALSSILELLAYDAGGIYLIDEGGTTARIACSRNMPPDFFHAVDPIDIREQPFSTVLVTGNLLICEDFRSANPDLAEKFGIRSLASVPVIGGERIIGCLNVASFGRTEISPDEREVLLTIGKELGSALQRMKTEDALRQSEILYGTLADAAQDLIYIVRKDDTIAYVNSFAEKVTRKNRQDIIGRSRSELFSETDGDRQYRNLQTVFSTGRPLRVEALLHLPGRETWQDTHLVPLKDADGSTAAVLGISRDITALKEAEKALRTSESNYRSIIENVQDMLYRTDMEGKITMISPAGVQRAGYNSPEEMIGLDLASTLYADPGERKKFLSILAKKGSVNVYPLLLRDRSGRQYHVTASSHYYYDDEGNRLGVEGIVHDVTHLRLAEDALREANRKLNLLNSITRHDVANQLTVLQGYTQLAMLKSPDPVIGDFLQKIHTVTDTIARQIEFSKTYQELGEQAPCWFSLDEIFVRNKPPDILFSCSCTGTEVYADPMLEKVFANLFSNAVMHGERVSRITIRCEPSGDDLLIMVEDNGIGIPLDLKQKIFKKGFGKNTGFGLFLAREILAITGIMIHETGSHGRGARFEIIVPKGGFRQGKDAGTGNP
jgi:PAS domain S-box-containing protein